MSWSADYVLNVAKDETSGDLDGWVTLVNHSGAAFKNAQLQLVAGDVHRDLPMNGRNFKALAQINATDAAAPVAPFAQESFSEYHLYSLPRPTTLHDGETKQVEFIHATGVKSEKVYVYDGLTVDWNRYGGWNMQNIRQNEEFGTQSVFGSRFDGFEQHSPIPRQLSRNLPNRRVTVEKRFESLAPAR